MNKKTLRRRLFVAAAVALGAFVIATLVIVASGLRDDIAHADVALVLGSKVELDGTPSVRLRARLDRTLELFRDGYFPSIIVSGGLGKEGYDEATVMREYLVSHGVSAAQVILDSHGDTTFASAENTARILKEQNFKSVFVVSQYFHIPRARLALSRCHVAVVHSAHAHFFEWRDIYSAARETVGFASYLLRSHD
ncbi:MAG: YdcF family protein [Chthoniobacteraceae bacterium]